jgi:hypothetical protein
MDLGTITVVIVIRSLAVGPTARRTVLRLTVISRRGRPRRLFLSMAFSSLQAYYERTLDIGDGRLVLGAPR